MKMKRPLLSFAAASILAVPCAAQSAKPMPPQTRTDNVKETLHGVELTDPYRWLEDQNAPETRAWIDAQNKYTESLLGALPGRDALEKRLGELLKVDVFGTPVERAGRYFFSKRRADQDLAVIYMRKGIAGADEVLIDPHPMSPDKTVSVDLLDVSQDGTLVAYSVRRGGADEVEMRLLDVATRKDLADVFPTARYFGISIAADKKGIYYTQHGSEGSRVRYHAFGTEMTKDIELFGKGYGPEKIIFSTLDESGKWLGIVVLHGSSADKTEIYLYNTAARGPVTTVVNDLDARVFPEFAGDTLLLHTNWKAAKGRVMAVPLSSPARANWKELIPEGSAVIEGISAAGGQVFVNFTENASSTVRAYDLRGKLLREVPTPALGTVPGIGGRWGSKEAFYSFQSFLIPSSVYRYDIASGKSEVWAKQAIPFDATQFEVKQIWYESKDKTRVPMFLVYRKGMKLDGANPTFLTGYGGFNVSMTPGFSARAAVWVEHGGVYALPNLRGGGEFGEEWHKAGMIEKKQNVFDDFYAAAEWLIANKYTSRDKLAIAGGSNGGLLVGAALTQRPDLFRAVVCFYPLLDMVRYHKFLVARFWVPEYGSSEDAKQFAVLRAYSPYHNVKPGTKYPAVLFVTGDADTRVAPLHARKMAALVQAANGSEYPVLLKYDTKAGHVGAKPVSKSIEDFADELQFLFWQLSVK